MSLVPSPLHAIVQVDGEAMVMHAGDKPYVVSPTGQVELASRGLTLEAVNGIVAQLLPDDIQTALDEFGAIQYELPAATQFPDEHFTVVAARGGDDLWIEIRRRRAHDDHVPEEFFTHASPCASVALPHEAQPPLSASGAPLPATPAAAPSAAFALEADMHRPPPLVDDNTPPPLTEPAQTQPIAADAPALDVAAAFAADSSLEIELNEHDDLNNDAGSPTGAFADTQSSVGEQVAIDDELTLPAMTQLWPAHSQWGHALDVPATQLRADSRTDTAADDFRATELEGHVVAAAPPVAVADMPACAVAATTAIASAAGSEATSPGESGDAPIYVETVAASIASEPTPSQPLATEPMATEPAASEAAHKESRSMPGTVPGSGADASQPTPEITSAPAILAPVEPAASSRPWPVAKEAGPVPAEPTPAVVLPIARSPIRAEAPPLSQDAMLSGLERLLRLSSARGASALYLWSKSRPSVRVDGELQILEGEPVLTSRDVDSLLLTLTSDPSREPLPTGASAEWTCEIEGVGRVRCMSFRDRHGPGGVFRLMPARSVSVEQIGLPKHVQALATESAGLVLVCGPRSSGKRTLMAALVDLMNRTRRDHIITIEREINIVHERGSSFISQREVAGGDDETVAAARGALREDPDVLVIDELRAGPLTNVALEAAASGRLVIGGFSAHTADGAIDRIIDRCAPEQRQQLQFAVAESLRGVIVQLLLRKIGGGRVPAREVLLNTSGVASLIADGKTSQLPMAIEGGRRHGMSPMNDALVSLVHSGAVEARDAYRQSADRAGFLAALHRQGIDTSFVERLA